MHIGRKAAALAGAAVLATMVAGVAVSQTSTADRSIRYRQGVLRAMDWHFGTLVSMTKGERPYDKAVATRAATFVEQLSHMPWDGFGPGTESGAPTKAKPEIWLDTDKFKQLAEALQSKTPKLAAAAQSGDAAQLGPAVKEVEDACRDCHRQFRAR